MDDTCTFEKLRHAAAREFAQTMIVIDDEANLVPEEPSSQPVGDLRPPSRITSSAPPADTSAKHVGSEKSDSQKLNAKSLIDNAMDLGLICSVLRPKKGENFQGRVVRAAKAADIVCLDWEIFGDGGDAASKIIADIIRADDKQNGRLRLIAIYTGDKTNDKILGKILAAIPEELREAHEFKEGFLQIDSQNGVRIVCLFKGHGIQLTDHRKDNQVGEDKLPERLQSAFANLSEGLLSNVALATIASIRSSTHHVLSKFSGQMDGPFFHHRALAERPEDAGDYAVDIVLSELKGAVDKRHVAATYAGPEAIKARIQEKAGNAEKLTLHYEDKGKPGTFPLEVDVSVEIVTDGFNLVVGKGKLPKSLGQKTAKKNLSSLFCDSYKAARSQMHQFAALTGVRAYPGSRPYHSSPFSPQLGLGTIVQDKDKTYLMCLQASCDSVRIKDVGNFLFVPLDTEDSKPEHVVPVPLSSHTHKFNYIGLCTTKESYRVVRSIAFVSCPTTKTVTAEPSQDRSGFDFVDTGRNAYRWIADLKRRRAFRTVQRLGQSMGRLGFDEFEPYRQKEQKDGQH